MRELFLDEGLEDRALDELRHVSSILHNLCFIYLKEMHSLTPVVSYSKVKSSSEGVYTIPGRQTAVSSAVQLWESKMMQSKAMEDIRKNNINSSNFVLQLPANYSQADQELTGNTLQLGTTCFLTKPASINLMCASIWPKALTNEYLYVLNYILTDLKTVQAAHH